MPLSHYVNNLDIIRVAVRAEREVALSPITIDTTAPGVMELALGTEAASRTQTVEFPPVLVGVAETRQVALDPITIDTTPAGATELALGTEAVSRTQTVELGAVTVDVAETRQVGLSPITLDATPPGATDIDLGTEAVSRTQAVATADIVIEQSVQTTRSVQLDPITIDTTMPATELDLGTEAASRTQSVAYSAGYNETFFDTILSTTASQCVNGFCETTTGSDASTDAGGQGAAGQSVTVFYDTASVSEHGSGTVTIRFLDGAGTELASQSDSFSGAGDSNSSFSFAATAPAGTEQIEVQRDVEASSQPVDGVSGCSGGDCTTEGSGIDGSIQVIT